MNKKFNGFGIFLDQPVGVIAFGKEVIGMNKLPGFYPQFQSDFISNIKAGMAIEFYPLVMA